MKRKLKLVKDWHNLHKLRVWPPGGANFIATLHWIALLAVGIELVTLSARVTSVKSQKGLSRTDRQTDILTQRSDQGHLGPIKINVGIPIPSF